MAIIFLFVTLLTLFVPGMAVMQLVVRRLDATEKLIIAPAVTIAYYGLAGIAGWRYPEHFQTISWATVAAATGLGLLSLALTRGLGDLRRVDRAPALAYVGLTLVATQIVWLPIKIPTEFPGHLKYMYYVQKDILPVRIQSLFYNAPNDNLVSYRFAELMLHGSDFRLPREWDNADRPAIAPGQSVTARTPLMALVGAHYINLFSPRTPVDGRYGVLGDLFTDESYQAFFLAAVAMNALMILPGYLIAREFAGTKAARITVFLLSLSAGMVIESSYIWPKALGSYFALLLAWLIIARRSTWLSLGALATLAFYSHQCAVAVVVGCCLFHLMIERPCRRALGRLSLATALGLVLLIPWRQWTTGYIHDSGNLITQNIFQNTSKGWWTILSIRIDNILRTVFPVHLAQSNGLSPNSLYLNAFFTLPGMVGVVLVPFFGAALYRRDRALLATLAGLGATVITAVTFGQVQAGLAPFGPFAFVPIAMALATTMLVRNSRPVVLTVLVLAFAEQMLVTWYAIIWPKWSEFATHTPAELRRFCALALVQGALFAFMLKEACRGELERQIVGKSPQETIEPGTSPCT